MFSMSSELHLNRCQIRPWNVCCCSNHDLSFCFRWNLSKLLWMKVSYLWINTQCGHVFIELFNFMFHLVLFVSQFYKPCTPLTLFFFIYLILIWLIQISKIIVIHSTLCHNKYINQLNRLPELAFFPKLKYLQFLLRFWYFIFNFHYVRTFLLNQLMHLDAVVTCSYVLYKYIIILK